MSTPSSDPAASLSLRVARQIDERCDQFEEQWKRGPGSSAGGPTPRIEDFLGDVSEAARPRLLEELLLLEVCFRSRAGESPQAADYAARFPELSSAELEQLIRRGMGRPQRGSTPGDASTIAHESGNSNRESLPRVRYFGDYELLEQIARGGMGVVYKARQISLNRIVAVKMILSGQFASESQVKRFRSEAESAAQLDHPNIVAIYEVGEHEGDHYFSMALVEGTSLAAQLSGGPLAPREAAEIVKQVAQAIQYAHGKGVIHRDLKPSNILLDQDRRPRVTDFGLAKRVSDSDGMTMTGDVLGTPSYMPPEQAAGKIDAVGPASDVYALGAVLYALLSGRPPFQAASGVDTLRQVVDQEPVRLRALNAYIPRDLETITQKCLEKSVARRYSTAGALAQDLDNYLTGRPIRARPTSTAERAWRWCRRNPVVASLAALSCLLLIVTTTVTSIAAITYRDISRVAEVARQDSDDARSSASLELARSRLANARNARTSKRAGQRTEALQYVAQTRDLFRQESSLGRPIAETDRRELLTEAASACLLPDLISAEHWQLSSPADKRPYLVSDPSTRRYARGVRGSNRIEVCMFGSDKPRWIILAPEGKQFTGYLSLSGNGQRLLSVTAPDDELVIWDLSGPEPSLVSSFPSVKGLRRVFLNHDGSIAAQDANPITTFVRIADGQVLSTEKIGGRIICEGRPLHPFRPWVAFWSNAHLMILDYQTLETVWKTPLEYNAPMTASWTLDGKTIVYGTTQGDFRSYNERGEPVTQNFEGTNDEVSGIAAAQSLGMVIHRDRRAGYFQLFDLLSGQRYLTVDADLEGPVSCTATGGLSLARKNNDVIAFQAVRGRLREFATGASTASLSYSERLLAVKDNARIELLDASTGNLVQFAKLPSGTTTILGFEPGDTGLLTYGNRYAVNQQIRRLPLSPQLEDKSIEFGEPSRPRSFGKIGPLWSLPDQRGDLLALFDFDEGVVEIARLTRDAEFCERAAKIECDRPVACSFSQDGRLVAVKSLGGETRIFSLDTGGILAILESTNAEGKFSAGGKYFFLPSSAGSTKIYRVRDWQPIHEIEANSVISNHDDTIFVADDGDNALRFFRLPPAESPRLEFQERYRLRPLFFDSSDRILFAGAENNRRILHIDIGGLHEDLKGMGLEHDWLP